MSGIAVAIGGSAVLGAVGTATGGFGSQKKAKMPDLPPFYEDPLYQKEQDYLDLFGTNMLKGELPDFYSSLGKTNSPEFQDLLKMTNRDTINSVNENLVRRGISRSGVGLSTVAKQVADTGTTLRWQDYLKASTEKGNLLNTGLNTLSGVRTAAQNQQAQKNQYAAAKAGMSIQIQQMENQQDAANEEALSSVIGSSISTLGSLAMMKYLNTKTPTTTPSTTPMGNAAYNSLMDLPNN